MKNLFCLLLLSTLTFGFAGCSGAPADEKPVKAVNTGAPAVDEKVSNSKSRASNDRGEAALEEKIRRGSKGGGGK